MEITKSQAIELYNDFDEDENFDILIQKRFLIEDAAKRLKEIKTELDTHLSFLMKEKNISEFRTGPEGNKSLIKKVKEKKEIVNEKALKKMLTSDDKEEKKAALSMMSGGQSAWKAPQVRLYQDSVGRKDLLETIFSDKIIVKVIPIEQLEAMGKIKSKKGEEHVVDS